jgi:hypothetical protein
MSAARACHCIVALILVGFASAAVSIVQASNESAETIKPSAPGRVNPEATTRGTSPAAKSRPAPTPPNRAQEVEERVRSGRMEPPIAQGDISERLNQLESGSNRLSDDAGTSHSAR